ncbi:hypothetical protein BJV82DRAFT_669433 [Fennellomyces sp. T-0311]|nr:hypothetical protein BJV82DRAFT_669433 [Fennellomyces sp. T-0311]
MLYEICQTLMAAALLYGQWSLQREVRSRAPILNEGILNRTVNQESSAESTDDTDDEPIRKRSKYTDSERVQVPSQRQKSTKRRKQKSAVVPRAEVLLDNEEDELSYTSEGSEYDPLHKNSYEEDSSNDELSIAERRRGKPVHREEQRFYCPYEGCEISRTHRPQLYHHIRSFHDANFTTTKGANHVFRTPLGENITFDESSQGMLKRREVIAVQRAPPKRRKQEVYGEKAYCPYNGCRLFCERRNILKHIRTSHNIPLTRRQIGVNYKVVLQKGTGDIIHLDDERCRDSLKAGASVDTVVVRTDFDGNRLPVVIPESSTPSTSQY